MLVRSAGLRSSAPHLRFVSNSVPSYSLSSVLRLSYHQHISVKPLLPFAPSLRLFSSETVTTNAEPVSPPKEESKPLATPKAAVDDEKSKRKAAREAKEQKKKERKERKDKKDKKVVKDVAPQNSSLIGVYDPEQIREYNSMLSEFVQKKERIQGEHLFNRFFTMGLQHDLETYNLMLQLYLNCNEYHNLIPLVRLLRDSTFKPTIQTYNLLMECYLITRNYSEVEYIYRKIRSEKLSPDLKTLSILLRYSLEIKDLKLALLYRTQFRYGDGYKLQNYNAECITLLFEICLSRFDVVRAEGLIHKLQKIQSKQPEEEIDAVKEEEESVSLVELSPEEKKKLEREKRKLDKKKKAEKQKRTIPPELYELSLKPFYVKLRKILLLINLNQRAAEIEQVINSLP